MKTILLAVSLFVTFIFLTVIPETNSSFTSSKSISGNQVETAVLLDFYWRVDKHAVGFKIDGISSFDQLDYKVSYNHGIHEEVVGKINLSGENSRTEEWIILGSCSGEVCTYHEGFPQVDLVVSLLRSGVVEKILTKILNI